MSLRACLCLSVCLSVCLGARALVFESASSREVCACMGYRCGKGGIFACALLRPGRYRNILRCPSHCPGVAKWLPQPHRQVVATAASQKMDRGQPPHPLPRPQRRRRHAPCWAWQVRVFIRSPWAGYLVRRGFCQTKAQAQFQVYQRGMASLPRSWHGVISHRIYPFPMRPIRRRLLLLTLTFAF